MTCATGYSVSGSSCTAIDSLPLDYTSDTLLPVDHCLKSCLLGGYTIVLSDVNATLKPYDSTPSADCACADLSGTVSGGTIYGSVFVNGSLASFLLTGSTGAVSLSVSTLSGASLGSVLYASAGCVVSASSFCSGSSTPPSSSNIGAAVGGAVAGGTVLCVVAVVAMIFYKRKRRSNPVARRSKWEIEPSVAYTITPGIPPPNFVSTLSPVQIARSGAKPYLDPDDVSTTGSMV